MVLKCGFFGISTYIDIQIYVELLYSFITVSHFSIIIEISQIMEIIFSSMRMYLVKNINNISKNKSTTQLMADSAYFFIQQKLFSCI